MTKQDFQFIAASFNFAYRQARYPEQKEGIADAAIILALRLEEKFPRFTKAKFLVACGLAANSRAVLEAKS